MKYEKIVSVDEIRQMDLLTCNYKKITSYDLMTIAGKRLYNAIIENSLVNKKDRVLIVCGKGNNGGDGLVIANEMIRNYYHVKVVILDDINQLSEQSKQAYTYVKDYCITENPYEYIKKSIKEYDILLDCIYGIGFHGMLNNQILDIVKFINFNSTKVISVDIPSGVNANNGLVLNSAIKANYTLCVQCLKFGNILNDGLDYSDHNIIVDIGILNLGNNVYKKMIDNTFYQENYIERLHNTHKYNFGNLIVFGGKNNMMGAPVLSCLGALKSGVGLATYALRKKYMEFLYFDIPDIMVSAYDEIEEAKHLLEKKDVIVFGPGLGKDDEQNTELLKYIISLNRKIIIDADGLYYLKKIIQDIDTTNIIITPHYGEFSKLINVSTEDIRNDPVGYVNRFVYQYDITIVLKGVTTIIANKQDMVFSSLGNPGMAKAGSGDVLSGVIAAHVGRKYDNFNASVMGVILHSEAARIAKKELGVESMLASDVVKYIPQAFKILLNNVKK